ncbi:MAG: N-acetyltransferase [Dehalococcoidia bacterium]|nr:N-acetyltransferase [Dehalococcoidia bacterium]
MEICVKKATITNVPQIHKLINAFAEQGEMLARPLSEIYENVRDFFVVQNGNNLLGTAALHVAWADIAEVKSLAVAEANHRQGLGKMLVQACLEEAQEIGIPQVFCLTYVPDFFAHCGFAMVDKSTLPHKIWGECYRCPKYPDCDETAMAYRISAS